VSNPPARSLDPQGAPLQLRSTCDGVVVSVRVVPRATRTGLAGIRDGRLLVRLTAPPVGGAANLALVRALAKAFALPRRAVRIVSGEHARQKTVLLEGVTPDTLLHRLATHA